MSPTNSAGIPLYPPSARGTEVLPGHLGIPLSRNRDAAASSAPKGEFTEELGVRVPAGEQLALGHTRPGGGKMVTVFAQCGDRDPAAACPGDSRWNGRRAPAVRRSSPNSTG